MNCQVCGSESGKYPLCRICNTKKENGIVIKCAKCGKWQYVIHNCTGTVSDKEAQSNEYAPASADILDILPPFTEIKTPTESPPTASPAQSENTPTPVKVVHPERTTTPPKVDAPVSDGYPYLYRLKGTLVSKSEQSFFAAIKKAIPSGYMVFPQIALRSFIENTDSSPYHNELFRIVDFLITDEAYHPALVIEINDQSHFLPDRKERDEKVKNICEEAGIPIIRLWTQDGVNLPYIKSKIKETLESLPVTRIHHFDPSAASANKSAKVATATPVTPPPANRSSQTPSYNPSYRLRRRRRRRSGCYVATCVYGSYDCPEVWTLRRFRDNTLASTPLGNAFIDLYYALSPSLVKIFGKSRLFRTLCKVPLDRIVATLKRRGVDDTPYDDQ